MALTFNNKNVYVGDWPKFTATFTDINDTPTDPSTITFKFRNEYRTATSYVYGTDSEVTKDSTGVYTARVQMDYPGTMFVRVESDSTFGAAYEDEFEVQPARFS